MNIDFAKYSDGLVPVVIQHADTLQVLMLGFMNSEAVDKTKQSGMVTFFSRSKGRLWTKGESSGNHLVYVDMHVDCDNDSLLISARPKGPVCHTGSYSCFSDKESKGFLHELEGIINERLEGGEQKSYVRSLFDKGLNKIAQKVGEEAVELIIESKDSEEELFKNEAADLLFHLLILLRAKGTNLEDIEKVLLDRHQKSTNNKSN